MIKKFLFISLLFFISLTVIIPETSYAREWVDLHEEDDRIFGSEKELKYNPDMFFLQRESWKDHYSFMLLWLFKYTDYPKYSSIRLQPFYYSLSSKLDNRNLSFVPLALTYWETDGNTKFKINPLFVAGSTRYENGEKDIFSFSLFHGYTYAKRNSMELPEKTWWVPIVPLIYRNKDSQGGHMNFLWLLDYTWKREKSGDENLTRFWLTPLLFHEPGRDGYTHMLPPVFIYNRHANGEYWMSFIPFFKRSKDIVYSYTSQNKDKNEYEDSFKSLIYCYNDVYKEKWGGEVKSTGFWFPFIPLLFYSYNEPGVESHRNLLALIDWHNDKNGNLDRFWFIPFIFHEPGDNGYTTIFPPVYFHNRHANGEQFRSLLPLFISSKDIVYDYSSGRKENKLYEDSITSPFFYSNTVYKDNWGGEEKSSSLWFPILPLFYTYNEAGVESHRNLLWLIDWHNDKNGNLDRFWFIPFFFNEPGENGYATALPPIFINNRHKSGEYWMSLFPFFMYSKDRAYSYSSGNKNSYLYENSFKSLLYCYNDVYKEKWDGELKSTELWFPVIPLFYSYNEPGVESHRNIFGLIDWHNNAAGDTDRFWFIPFYFSGKNSSYRFIFPPLFISLNVSEEENYSHLVPIYLSSSSSSFKYDTALRKAVPTSENLFLTFLWGYSSTKSADGTGNIDSRSYWFPIIPLYYHSADTGGSHSNFLWAFDWERDSAGDLTRFFILPFIFHQPGEGGYRYYFPFYFRPGGWTEKKGVSYSPLYYHNWSEDEETRWSWLVHYKNSNFKTGEYLNTWFPVYYHHNVPSEGETTSAALLYYHHDSLKYGGYFARIAAPLYWNIETGSRETTLFLPLYFETVKKDGKGSFYINIAGISKSVVSGVNPVIDAGLGFNKKGLYVDVDASWLIDMFSLSTRITIPMKSGQEPAAEEEVDTAKGDVKLTKKSGVNRDSSINFWGWHFMYGLVAYEQADTKRHFRLLPLSWITWDDESDQKMKVILNYISYKEDDTVYNVFFPIWGYQRVGESYSLGILLNAFWYEYDKDKEMDEYTILWPVFNTYSSPERNGWRILPVVWHKSRADGDISRTSTVTPLWMDFHHSKTSDNSVTYRLNFSPLHFYRYNEDLNGNTNEISKLWFSTIPVIFYKNNGSVTRSVKISTTEKANSNKQPAPGEEYSVVTTSSTLHWFMPFYFMKEISTDIEDKGLSVSELTLAGLPLIYYHSITEKDSNQGGEEKKSGSLFVAGYYHEFSSALNTSSILFGLYKSEKYPVTGNYSYSLIYGLFNVSENGGDFKNYLFPLYYYRNNNGSWENSALLGIYSVSGNPAVKDSSTSLLYSIFKTSLTHYPYNAVFIPRPVEERETWLVPFFYYSNIESADSKTAYNKNVSLSILHYRESIIQSTEESFTFGAPIIPLVYYSSSDLKIPGAAERKTSLISPLFYRSTQKKEIDDSYTFWAPIIPIVYYSSDNNSNHLNLLWLADYEKNKTADNTRFWLMPLVFSKTGDDGYFHLAPLYFSDWNDKDKDYTYIICGLYFRNSPGYSRQNFFYLFDHISEPLKNRDEYSFLFSTFEYRVDPEIREMQALWGLLANAEWNSSRYNIEALLYLAAVERNGDYFHTRAIPLWYYESNKDSHTLVIPPALTWDSEESDRSRLQLWAGGALWFRNYDPKEKSDFQAALLGIPYYKYQTAERGYESRGSLWSILWEYETENERGYSRFSLLKFLYKRVEMDGEVYHKVLGITF